MNHRKQNEGIMRLAARSGHIVSLCNGGAMAIDFSAVEDDTPDTEYFISLFHPTKKAAVSKFRTLHTVHTVCGKRAARKQAAIVANQWGYQLIDTLDEKRNDGQP